MRWILAGYCGLALITLTVSLQVNQKPRFYGMKTESSVSIYCLPKEPRPHSIVEWYKADEYKAKKRRIFKEERIVFRSKDMIQNAILDLINIKVEDSGVYYCKLNGTEGTGTELQAVRHINLQKAQYRSRMKDGLIVIQGLLLAFCIAATMLHKQRLMEKSEDEYEEPENDHIYEGLAIETCGGDLYEDLSVYAQAEGAEAPWE